MRRATLRGDERTPLAERADVLICGASFAGLAVARELAGAGADVLGRRPLRDRRAGDVGLRGAHAMAARDGRRALDPAGDPLHGVPHAARVGALPAAVELVELRLPRAVPRALEQTDARFEIAKVSGAAATPSIPTAASHAPLIVDALGWRRVLGPGRTSSRRRPRSRAGSRSTRTAAVPTSTLDRPLPGPLRLRLVGSAAGEQRIGVGSYEPRHHVKEPTKEIAAPLPSTPSATRATGSRTGCAPPPRTACSSPATAPATACRSRARASGPRSTSGSRPARDPRRARRRAHARAGARALRRVLAPPRAGLRLRARAAAHRPRLPPRALTALLKVMGRERPCRRAFGWYLAIAPPP